MSSTRTRKLTGAQIRANAKRTTPTRFPSSTVKIDPSLIIGDREPCTYCGTRADYGCKHQVAA